MIKKAMFKNLCLFVLGYFSWISSGSTILCFLTSTMDHAEYFTPGRQNLESKILPKLYGFALIHMLEIYANAILYFLTQVQLITPLG